MSDNAVTLTGIILDPTVQQYGGAAGVPGPVAVVLPLWVSRCVGNILRVMRSWLTSDQCRLSGTDRKPNRWRAHAQYLSLGTRVVMSRPHDSLLLWVLVSHVSVPVSRLSHINLRHR